MTQSLQSILSEREKLLRWNFLHSETCSAFCNGECNQAHTHFDGADCDCYVSKLLSFHAETARLVAEAVEKNDWQKIYPVLCNVSQFVRGWKSGTPANEWSEFDEMCLKQVEELIAYFSKPPSEKPIN